MALGKICRIKDCKNILKITDGQVCASHRHRFQRHGSYDISPNWTMLKKGKPHPTTDGYLRIHVSGERMLYHRHLMEKHLGRKLKPKEIVHHKNSDPSDNRIENLELVKSQAMHIKEHHHIKKRLVDWSLYNIPKKNIKGNCLISGCDRKTRCRALCEKHTTAFYKQAFKR